MSIFAFEGIDEFSEDLNLTEHMDAQAEASRTGDFDELKEKSQELIDSAIETDTTDVGADGGESNQDVPVEDSPEDIQGETTPPSDDENPAAGDVETTKDDEKDSKEDKPVSEETKDESESGDEEQTVKDGKFQTAATESLRSQQYNRSILTYINAIPATEDDGSLSPKTRFFEIVRNLTKYLSYIGAKYTPVLLNFVKKSTIYLLTNSVKLTLKTAIYIADHEKRTRRSFEKQTERIQKLKTELKKKSDSTKPLVMKEKTKRDPVLADWFYTDLGVSQSLSAKTLLSFCKTTLQELSSNTEHLINETSELLNAIEMKGSKNLLSTLTVTPLVSGFGKKTLPSIKTDQKLTTMFVYEKPLPGKRRFVSVIPNTDLHTLKEMSEAYQSSEMFFSPYQSFKTGNDAVDYMDIKGVDSFLNELEEICNLGNDYAKHYDRLTKNLSSLKPGYRNFYQKLCESKEEAKQREEVLEYIYLKQMFLSRVYIPSAIDIHDYIASFLTKSLKHVEECLENLREEESTV